MLYSLGQIAEKIGGTLYGDPQIEITGVASITEAKPGQLTFVANQKYRAYLKTTRATAVIIAPAFAEVQDQKSATNRLALIEHSNPYYAFGLVLSLFHPEDQKYTPGIHPLAVVDSDALLGRNVHLGPYVVIEKNVRVDDNSVILAGAFVGQNSQIGNDCLVYPNVTIREKVKIGNRCIIHSGTVIGADGFGFAKDQGVYHKIPQVGGVIVEDDVEIGANVTIDRGTLGNTIIGKGSKIDNLVQIAHNVVIGENCIIVAQVGISGSTRLGKNVTLAGQAGLVGHLTIGDNVTVAAQSGIHKDLKPNTVYFGYPARELNKQKRIEAVISHLPEYIERLRILEKKIMELEKKVPK